MRSTKGELLWHYRLILLAVVLAFWVVGLGAFTRLVDAGLGCPDWPGCYGHLMWPDTLAEQQVAEQRFPGTKVDTAKTWPEMVHRYFAGSLGLLIVAIAVFAYRLRQQGVNIPLRLPIALIVLVTVQAAFGMWTVTLKLLPQVVTAHLLGGFSTLALLWLLSLRVRQRFILLPAQEKEAVPQHPGPQRAPLTLGVLLLLFVVLQIALGGWVSSNYAALVCSDLPTCQGQWWPQMDFANGFSLTNEIGPNYEGGVLALDARTAIHIMHRIGALVVCALAIVFIVGLFKNRFNRLAYTLLAVLGLQLCLGISNIVFALPLAVAVAHNIVGAMLLLALVNIIYTLFKHNQSISNARVVR